MCIYATVRAPIHTSPSAAAAGSAAGPVFALFFALVTGSAYTGVFAPTHFWGQIKPGNVLTYVYFPSGPST